jgi:hypothetical protein
MAAITRGSVIVAISFSRPEQWGHSRAFFSKTRFIKSAHASRLGRSTCERAELPDGDAARAATMALAVSSGGHARDLADHSGTGHREGTYDGMRHLRRYIGRSIRRSPLGFLRFLRNAAPLELAAKRRKRAATKTET